VAKALSLQRVLIINVMSTFALNKLLEYILSLSLSNKNKDWLAAKIIESKTDITPSLKSQITKARKELQKGETIACSTPEEMQHYFDSL